MDIYLNGEGKMDFTELNKQTTIKDYLDEIDNFLEKNPVSCFSCEENCCARDWNIELDIVFFNRYLVLRDKFDRIIDDLISINKLLRPVFKDSPCKFLNNNNLCSIYQKRPFICRAYNCYPETERYKILKDLILEGLNYCLLVKLQLQGKHLKLKGKIDKDLYQINNKLPLSITDYQITIYELVKSIKNLLDDYRYKKFSGYLEA